MEVQDSNKLEISRVAVKPPPFWQEKPHLWFLSLESQFFTAGIKTNETKYHYVVSALSGEILEQISDVLSQPLTESSYELLKTRLISCYSASASQKLRKLLSGLDLGDSKPSALLRQMRDLAGNQLQTDALKSLWLQHLPQTTQAILAVSADDLDKLAEMADKIAEISLSSEVQSIAGVSKAVDSTDSINSKLDMLSSKWDKLEERLSKLEFQFKEVSEQKFRARSRSASNRPYRSKSKSKQDPEVCWFHRTFQDKANRCTKPCGYKPPLND